MTDTASERRVMAQTAGGTASWWDWRLLGFWVLVNGAAFLVIPVVAILLERLASAATQDLFDERPQDEGLDDAVPKRCQRVAAAGEDVHRRR